LERAGEEQEFWKEGRAWEEPCFGRDLEETMIWKLCSALDGQCFGKGFVETALGKSWGGTGIWKRAKKWPCFGRIGTGGERQVETVREYV